MQNAIFDAILSHQVDEISNIVQDIRAGNVKPIYFLMGEEPYYIDKLAGFIEDTVLAEEEKGFNQTIFYGRDVAIEDVLAAARRFPMMAEKQVIIVREAQDLSRTIEQLQPYVASPLISTVLVICYKYKVLDKKKKLYKELVKSAVLFEGKKIYDKDIPAWITKNITSRGLQIEAKAAAMLADFLGTDLSKIANELGKLQIILPKGTTITSKHIEDNIGISKDFNNFELTEAIASRNRFKAFQIADYFASNPKENPLVQTLPVLYNFFSQLLQYHAQKDKSQKNICAALGVNYYRFLSLQQAAMAYNMKKCSATIAFLRQTDVRGKGVDSLASHPDLLKELLVSILD